MGNRQAVVGKWFYSPQFWNQGQISAGERSRDLTLVFKQLFWRMSKPPIKPPPWNDWQDTRPDTNDASEHEEDSGVLSFCNAPSQLSLTYDCV